MELEEKFKNAVDIVQNMPKSGPVATSNDEKLIFYGLFKQATIGPCNVDKPGIWNMVERYKWDAWNKLEDLGKEQAMEQYVEQLLHKINEVEKTHDVKEWLVGDLFELMRPKFAVIGKMYKGDEEEEPEAEEPKNTSEADRLLSVATPEGSMVEIPPMTPNGATTTTDSVLSDAEYCDAVDNEEQFSRSRSSSYEMHDSPRSNHRRSQNIKHYCEKVETQLKKISGQIELLNNAVELRHSSLLSVFKKATVYMFVPKGVSWATVVFFFFWPFIAHFLMRYLGKWVMMRLRS